MQTRLSCPVSCPGLVSLGLCPHPLDLPPTSLGQSGIPKQANGVPLPLSSLASQGLGPELSWARAGSGIFLGWAPETLTLCRSLEERSGHYHVSGRHQCGGVQG